MHLYHSTPAPFQIHFPRRIKLMRSGRNYCWVYFITQKDAFSGLSTRFSAFFSLFSFPFFIFVPLNQMCISTSGLSILHIKYPCKYVPVYEHLPIPDTLVSRLIATDASSCWIFSSLASLPVLRISSIFLEILSPTPGNFLASSPDVNLSNLCPIFSININVFLSPRN